MKHLLIALIWFPVAVFANCLRVDVLPVEVVEDTSRSHAEISRMTDGVGTFGAVITSSIVTFEWCVLTVGYRPMMMFIARELLADRCALRHVRGHEMRHVEIYREGLVGIEDRIVLRVTNGETPIEAANAEIAAIRARQEAHDSPEEYALNRFKCNGRILAAVK
jgi:hypothetical protein